MKSLVQYIKEAMEHTTNSVGGDIYRFVKRDLDKPISEFSEEEFVEMLDKDIQKAVEDYKIASKATRDANRKKYQKDGYDRVVAQAQKYADTKYKRDSAKKRYVDKEKKEKIDQYKSHGEFVKNHEGNIKNILVQTSKGQHGLYQYAIGGAAKEIFAEWEDNKEILGYDICVPVYIGIKDSFNSALYVYPLLTDDQKERDEESYKALCAAMDDIYGRGGYTGD